MRCLQNFKEVLSRYDESSARQRSRYMLVTAVAVRARQLQDQPEKLGNNKPVSMAVEELYEDKLVLTTSREN